MLTEAQKNTAEKDLQTYLSEHYSTTISRATEKQLYFALAELSQKYLYQRMGKCNKKNSKDRKTIHYMSIEFLLGRMLKNNLWNLELEETYKVLLKENNKNIDDVYNVEHDPGLGNGGLGRLAACYLDSISRLGYPGFGHCLKYEYGLFKQIFIDGKQIEVPDGWLDTGNVWLNPREDQAVEVMFGGTVKQVFENNRLSHIIESPKIVKAMPYDMLISGYDSNTVSILRLWEAEGITKSFNLTKFNNGEFIESLREENKVKLINKLLYPTDKTAQGKKLRHSK